MFPARILAVVALLVSVLVSHSADSRVYRDRVTAHWSADGSKFWYRNDLPGGKAEFIQIEAETGRRETLKEAPKWSPDEPLRADLQVRPSARTGEETRIYFDNRRSQAVELFWMDDRGARRSYGVLESGARREMQTFSGHVWLVTEGGRNVAVFEATDSPSTAIIDVTGRGGRTERLQQRQRDRGATETSPNGKWSVFVRENNLFLRAKEGGAETQLTTDGKDGLTYGRHSWSPDSKSLAAWRIERAERKDVYLVESSPRDGGRAKLQTRGYSLPGDPFTKYELSVFDVESRKQIKPEIDQYEHEYSPPRINWRADGSRLSYMQVDRGHQRLRVIEVNPGNGKTRNIIDEHSKTFIWSAHTEALNAPLVTWMEESDEMIYLSENSGWRHLYLVDPEKGHEPMTAGDWVVRGIERIDEAKRQVWFRASGIFTNQDPYLVHVARVNFDGSGLVFLTEGDGNHTVQYSPDRRFIIDSYSRVNMAPVTELRRAGNGKLVCKLEEADTAELKASDWQAPEVFVAKGRDGVTDIWGIICRPKNLDSSKKYPILEDIYAGPQGSFVPKTFSARGRYDSWNNLGFVVVKIDGMGTANRSKDFHDVCFKNLKDGGFEDRILWMKAAAKKYPYLDITRVGVYGTSAGGQNAAAAVIFHSEFYKAAIANCGCHDNRMDKASWNEQWMGYPVGPQYEECSNIDNAGKLGGALFLIVGELDTNVPPESTYRLADALIKADKDFEYLVVPGADHGVRGPATPYVQRRMQDFFKRSLMQ